MPDRPAVLAPVPRRHHQARVAGPGRLAAPVPARGSTIAAASATASVASMPCSPATARSRARWTSVRRVARPRGPRPARCSSSTWPYFSAWSACASFQATSSRMVRIGAPSGRVGEVGVEVAGELVEQHRELVGLRQRGHLDEDRAAVAQHVQGGPEDLAPPARAARRGSRRHGQADAAQGVGAGPLAVRLAGQHPEQRRGVGDGPAHRTGAVLAAGDGQDAAAGHQAERRLEADQALVRRGRQDRPVGLGADRHGGQPECGRCARPAAGAARVVALTSYGLSTWPPSEE